MTMNKYPQWVGALTIRKTISHSRVIVYSNPFGCKILPKIKSFTIPKKVAIKEAVQIALIRSDSIFLHSRGCWINTQVKLKYGDINARRELFSEYCRMLKAKYDGVNYLYGSKEAQDEIIRALKIPDIKA